MQFKPYEPGIEVAGEAVGATVDAFRNFPTISSKYLEKFKIMAPGQKVFDRKKWYPMEAWLLVHEAMSKEIGANAMFKVGEAILGTVPVPPVAKDVHSAMIALDFGYHSVHRKNGLVMFDPTTLKTLSGIGNFMPRAVEGENKIIIVANNPYDCDFDRGVITALATKFQPRVKVVHDDGKPCRKRGADSCNYIVSW